MVIAEPPWLHTLGQISGVILVLELSLALIITCALMIALAYGIHWLHVHVMPYIETYAPQVQSVMNRTEQGSDRVVQGVAEFYGRRQAVETGIRVMLFGKKDVENVREEQQIYAEETLQRITAPSGNLSRPRRNHNNHNAIEGRRANTTRPIDTNDAANDHDAGA